MAGLFGISSFNQSGATWQTDVKKTGTSAPKSEKSANTKVSGSGVSVRSYSPIDPNGPLAVRESEYGSAVGEVKLSDKAKDYYEQLKEKFGDCEFLVVSKDMMEEVQKNSASYGSSTGTLVIIDEEELEQMANDESIRSKNEGLIQEAQVKMKEFAESLEGKGTSVKNFGMSIDKDGNVSYFATIEKAGKQQKQRIEDMRASKREEAAREAKEAKKEAFEKRIDKNREARKEQLKELSADPVEGEQEESEYLIMEASSWEDLFAHLEKFSYDSMARDVMTESEKSLGQSIDFKG